MAGAPSNQTDLLQRITFNPHIYGGKAIIRNRRMAVEHVLAMLAAGDTEAEILDSCDWLEPDDIRACLLYAAKTIGGEYIEPTIISTPPSEMAPPGEAA